MAGKLAVAEQSKTAGNHYYKLKMHRAAVRDYKYVCAIWRRQGGIGRGRGNGEKRREMEKRGRVTIMSSINVVLKGISILQDLECTDVEQQKVDQMLVLLNLNLAADALQTRMYDIAIMNCDKV